MAKIDWERPKHPGARKNSEPEMSPPNIPPGTGIPRIRTKPAGSTSTKRKKAQSVQPIVAKPEKQFFLSELTVLRLPGDHTVFDKPFWDTTSYYSGFSRFDFINIPLQSDEEECHLQIGFEGIYGGGQCFVLDDNLKISIRDLHSLSNYQSLLIGLTFYFYSGSLESAQNPYGVQQFAYEPFYVRTLNSSLLLLRFNGSKSIKHQSLPPLRSIDRLQPEEFTSIVQSQFLLFQRRVSNGEPRIDQRVLERAGVPTLYGKYKGSRTYG
jgi:hypothetical protein